MKYMHNTLLEIFLVVTLIYLFSQDLFLSRMIDNYCRKTIMTEKDLIDFKELKFVIHKSTKEHEEYIGYMHMNETC